MDNNYINFFWFLFMLCSYKCVRVSLFSAASGALDQPPGPHQRERSEGDDQPEKSERDDQPEKSERPMGEPPCSLLQTVPNKYKDTGVHNFYVSFQM